MPELSMTPSQHKDKILAKSIMVVVEQLKNVLCEKGFKRLKTYV